MSAVPRGRTGGQGRPDDGPLLVLTSQELGVLERVHARGLAPTPGPDADGPAEPSGQLSQARRSLTARGLLTPRGGLPGTDVGLLLQTVLDLRVAADSLVIVERVLGEGRRDLRLLHLAPGAGVVEDVHPEGLHGLDLALVPDALVDGITAMLVPKDARAGHGGEVVVSSEEVTQLPVLLHRPTVLAELTRLVSPSSTTGSTGEEGHLVALGPHGCWAGRRPRGAGALRLRPVGPGWVRGLAGSWVHPTMRAEEGGTMAR